MKKTNRMLGTIAIAAILATGCLVPPIVLTRVEKLDWVPFEVSPEPGVTLALALPVEPETEYDFVEASCDGTPYRDLAYKICNAPLAYYPPRYGTVANFGVFVGGERDLSVFGPPQTSATGVTWRYHSVSRGERGDTYFALTFLPSGTPIMVTSTSTASLPEGYLEAILREGIGRFEIR